MCGDLTRDERKDQLEEMVLEISEIDELVAGTPQSDAFIWLVNVDEMGVCPDEEEDVEQRYIMALLYYSTDGDNWRNCSAVAEPGECPSETTQFLSGDDVCFWFGVSCNKGTINGISVGK
jgi:hypothetical protein